MAGASWLICGREAPPLGARELSEQLSRAHAYASQVELGRRWLDSLEFLNWAAAAGLTPEEAAAAALVKLYKRVRKRRTAAQGTASAKPRACKE